MNILEEIIAHKKIEVDKAKDNLPLDRLKNLIRQKDIKKRDFFYSLQNKTIKKEIALIAEIKKASPSKGVIKEDFNHIEIAKAYRDGGACSLSVLTDQKYFQGKLSYIPEIKEVVDLPVLRKDFIVDPYQIYESIYYGADCILLIAGVLEKDILKRLYELSQECETDCLIEIHDEREMEIALDIVGVCHSTPLLGINNRNLNTFETNLNTTKRLVQKYKRDLNNKVIVSESGISSACDIKELTGYGVYAFLVGGNLIKNKDIELATKRLVSI